MYLLAFIFIIYSSLSNADTVYEYYQSPSLQAAYDSCIAWNPSCTYAAINIGLSNGCSTPTTQHYYSNKWTAANTRTYHSYFYCVDGPAACPISGQTRDNSQNGVCQCPPGQSVVGGACSGPLPDCSSLGVDVNSFVVKCSEMLDGSPTQCLNSDNTPFALQGCPTLTCPDGSTTVYPTPCPVASCPEGFTLSDVSGVGKTCVMPLPDDDLQNPCVNVSGSDVPLCAEDGKNCQMVNGTFVCLKEEITPPSDSTCYSINSKNYCLSNQPTIETEKTSTTNPDGSTTVREVMTPSINGVPARVKETTTYPDGSVTIISNNPGDLTDLGLQQQPQKIDLSKVEKNTKDTADNTKGILDWLNDTDNIDQSDLELSSLDSALQSDMDSFEAFVNQSNPAASLNNSHSLSAAFGSLLPEETSCSGGIHTTIFNRSFDLEPCEKLLPLREILAWFFSIWTVWIILNLTSKSIVRF